MSTESGSLISGVICMVVTEYGPEMVANVSDLKEDQAFMLGAQIITLSGFTQSLEEDANRIIGPLPVKSSPGTSSLLYFHTIENEDSSDARIVEHGSLFGVIMLFDESRASEIRRAIGLLEPYLKRYLHNNLSSVKDINPNLGSSLLTFIKEIVSKPQIRAFWYDTSQETPRLLEYKDPHAVFKDKDIIIIDELSKQILVLTSPETSAFEARKLHNLVNTTNMNLYRNSMSIKIMDSFEEIEPILHKYGIVAN